VTVSVLRDVLSVAPIWQIGLVLFACLWLGAVAGGYLRRRSNRRRSADESENDEATLLISSVLGLMALLIAFTFAIGVDRFDTRRTNVLNEANAIGTTYLRAQLLDPPHRERLSRLLAEYTDVRIELATKLPGERQRALIATSDGLIVDLWAATVAANPSIRSQDNAYSFLETMNQLIDMDATRKAGRQSRIPVVVFAVLFTYQFIISVMVGYTVSGLRARRTSVTFLLLLTVMVCLILDLDRPNSGLVIESQEPMLQLQAFLAQQPPASFDRFVAAPADAGD
jgi:hypothetical protein